MARLLANEQVEKPVIEWLREQGHDVLYACEESSLKSHPDTVIEARARQESRIVFSHDYHYWSQAPLYDYKTLPGVIICRVYPPKPETVIPTLINAFKTLDFTKISGKLVNMFQSGFFDIDDPLQ